MNTRSYLIIHGLGGSEAPHWQAWLYDSLKTSHEKVYFPNFPDPDSPRLDTWMEVLKKEVEKLEGEKFVICHSLGCILWLHYANLSDAIKVDHLLLVAPPGTKALEKLSQVQGFLPIPLEREKVAASAKEKRLVCSNSDSYCEEIAAIYFGETLQMDVDILPDDAQHINVNSGYGPWEEVKKWCQDPSYRIEK